MGGFFSISGYVAAYTTTKLRERSHDAKKLKEPELFFWQKVTWPCDMYPTELSLLDVQAETGSCMHNVFLPPERFKIAFLISSR